MSRHGRSLTVAAIAGLLAACSPTSPNPSGNLIPNANAAPTGSTLFGKVVDNAWRTVSGARVEVVEGEGAGASAVTNDAGRYQLPGAFNGTISVRISRESYVTSTSKVVLPRSSPTDFVIEFTGPSTDLAGSYTVTFRADAVCTQLPETARLRSYEASIRRSPAPPVYIAELSGASFYDGYFTASVAGSFASFQTDAVGNHIHERLTPTTSLWIDFAASAPVDAPSISVPMFATYRYCADDDPGGFSDCRVAPVTCTSSNNTFTLTLRHR